jgi:hypothetical protein
MGDKKAMYLDDPSEKAEELIKYFKAKLSKLCYEDGTELLSDAKMFSEKVVNEIIETNPLNSINYGSKVDYWTDVLSHVCVYGD